MLSRIGAVFQAVRAPVSAHVRRHWLFLSIQLAAVICASVWWVHLPAPGYAIGVLAVLAAVMSIHIEKGMTAGHQAFWLLLIGVFLVIELRAISADRADFAEREAARRAAEATAFQNIASGISKSISDSDRNFAVAIAGIKTSINTMTGGASFCYMQASDGGTTLTFVQEGDYPLFDVSVRIVDLLKFNQIIAASPHPTLQQFLAADTQMQLGEFPAHSAVQRGTLNLDQHSGANFNLFFSARNGFWTQELRLRWLGGKWVQATRVTRVIPNTKKIKELFRKVDKDYPLNAKGDIDWN